MTTDTQVIIKRKPTTKTEISKPALYKVIFHNDDFTPFMFVEAILKVIFNKTQEEANQLAQEIHNNQKAIIALYPKEIALTKQQQTEINARNNGYPLLCEIEPE